MGKRRTRDGVSSICRPRKVKSMTTAPYRIETERLVLRCYDPEDAPLLKDAVDRSLEHLRPWMPWTPDEPEALDTVYERLRGFRGRYDLGEDYVDGSLLARRLARARRGRAAHEAGRGRARDRLLDRRGRRSARATRRS